MDRRVAKRYAAAIFRAALKADLVRPVEDDLKAVVALLDGDPKFKDFILSPETRRDHKREIIDRLLADRVNRLTLDAVHLLLVKRREGELWGVADEYEILRRENQKVIYIRVTSAEPLSETQRKALLEKLSHEIGKTLDPEFAVDPTLIGGVRVAYENMVLDGSVRGGLARLQSILQYDVLKQA